MKRDLVIIKQRAIPRQDWRFPRCSRTMAFLIVLALFCIPGCGEEEKPKSQFGVASSGLNSAGGGSVAADEEKPWIQGTGEEAINYMMAYAKALDIRSKTEPLPEKIADMYAMVEIADDMAQFELNESQMEIAFQIKVGALLELQKLADRKARETLLEFTMDNLEHDNQQISRMALTALITVRLKDYVRTSDGKFDRLKNRIEEILNKFPNHEQVANELEAVVIALIQRDRREAAKTVMNMMKATYSKSDNKHLVSLSTRLSDRVYLTELEFDKIMTQFKKGTPEGEEQFMSMVKEFVKNRQLGPEIYDEVSSALRWFELKDKYDEVRKLNQQITANLFEHSDTELRKRIIDDVERSTKRLSLLDSKFTFAGNLADGTPFDLLIGFT